MTSVNIQEQAVQAPLERVVVDQNAAKKIIGRYTLLSSGAALVPIDFVDVITSTVAQTMMIKDLCQLYKVPFSEKMLNVAGWSAIGTLLTKVITGIVSSVLSTGSFNEQFDLTGAAVAGIYTATMGEFYNLHFKAGGTLADLNITDFTDFFISEIKNGDLSIATFTNPKALLNYLNVV